MLPLVTHPAVSSVQLEEHVAALPQDVVQLLVHDVTLHELPPQEVRHPPFAQSSAMLPSPLTWQLPPAHVNEHVAPDSQTKLHPELSLLSQLFEQSPLQTHWPEALQTSLVLEAHACVEAARATKPVTSAIEKTVRKSIEVLLEQKQRLAPGAERVPARARTNHLENKPHQRSRRVTHDLWSLDRTSLPRHD